MVIVSLLNILANILRTRWLLLFSKSGYYFFFAVIIIFFILIRLNFNLISHNFNTRNLDIDLVDLFFFNWLTVFAVFLYFIYSLWNTYYLKYCYL